MRVFLPEVESERIYMLRSLYWICTTLHITTKEAEIRVAMFAKECGISYDTAFDELADIAIDYSISKELKKKTEFDETFGF